MMALVQPCTNDRVASGPARWIGPIADSDSAAALRDWLVLGQWENIPSQGNSIGISAGHATRIDATDA